MKAALHRRLWEGWKRVGRKIGDFQARILLTVFYFLVLAPFALGLRLLADPLGLKRPGGWQAVPPRGATPIERARQQF
jgi:hypothetical protein